LLGQEEQPRPNYHQPKEPGLPRCVGNAEPNDGRTLPPELKPGNPKKLGTTASNRGHKTCKAKPADNTRYEPTRKATPNAKPEQPNPAGLQAEAAGTKAHNPSRNKNPSPTPTQNANPKEPITTKAGAGRTT